MICPSIIANSQTDLESKINLIKKTVKRIHLDVMDKHFVVNSSLQFRFSLPRFGGLYEYHLMVKKPKSWLKLHNVKNGLVILHAETRPSLNDYNRYRLGLALNPKTPITAITPYLNRIEQVLILSVNPGRYGARFCKSTVNKVKELRKLNKKINIEVDGSINQKTLTQMKLAGANIFVSGSYIFNNKKLLPNQAVSELERFESH